jgi:hypothetical protein
VSAQRFARIELRRRRVPGDRLVLEAERGRVRTFEATKHGGHRFAYVWSSDLAKTMGEVMVKFADSGRFGRGLSARTRGRKVSALRELGAAFIAAAAASRP